MKNVILSIALLFTLIASCKKESNAPKSAGPSPLSASTEHRTYFFTLNPGASTSSPYRIQYPTLDTALFVYSQSHPAGSSQHIIDSLVAYGTLVSIDTTIGTYMVNVWRPHLGGMGVYDTTWTQGTSTQFIEIP